MRLEELAEEWEKRATSTFDLSAAGSLARCAKELREALAKEKFVVEDESLVPRAFCSPDPKKIGTVDPTATAIPGVRFYQEPVVSSRRG